MVFDILVGSARRAGFARDRHGTTQHDKVKLRTGAASQQCRSGSPQAAVTSGRMQRLHDRNFSGGAAPDESVRR
jgi:hypothetical protein